MLKTVTSRQEETLTAPFIVQFWGVRDAIPTPGKATLEYGGNTSCVEMRVGNQRFIFDGGTGLRQLGNNLLSQMPIEASMFFTHCHWDRIQGFPFFVPAFIPGNHFHIYGATTTNGTSFQESLRQQMLHPNFPVPLNVMQADMKFYALSPQESENFGDVTINVEILNPAHASTGYRITWEDHAVVYATDSSTLSQSYESKANDSSLLHLAQNADLLILGTPNLTSKESSDPELYWQNPFWQHLAKVQAAGVKHIIISTHDPDCDDDFLNCVEAQIPSDFSNLTLAREGMEISVA